MSLNKKKLQHFINEAGQNMVIKMVQFKNDQEEINFLMQTCIEDASLDIEIRQRHLALLLVLFGSHRATKNYLFQWASATQESKRQSLIDLVVTPVNPVRKRLFNDKPHNFNIENFSILAYLFSQKMMIKNNKTQTFIKATIANLAKPERREQSKSSAFIIMQYTEEHPKNVSSDDFINVIKASKAAIEKLLNPSLSSRIARKLFGQHDFRERITNEHLVDLILNQPDEDTIRLALRKPKWYEFNSKYFSAMLTPSQWAILLTAPNLLPHKKLIEQALQQYENSLPKNKRQEFKESVVAATVQKTNTITMINESLEADIPAPKSTSQQDSKTNSLNETIPAPTSPKQAAAGTNNSLNEEIPSPTEHSSPKKDQINSSLNVSIHDSPSSTGLPSPSQGFSPILPKENHYVEGPDGESYFKNENFQFR